MIHTGNRDQIPDDCRWQDAAGLVTRELGRSVGSRKLYANVDTLPPGTYSTRYHSHTQQEEFFYVLSGTGTLRLDGREQPVGPGDFLAKPAGEGIAHTYFNAGPEPLVILDVGTCEPEDTCYYPDERMYRHKANGIVRTFSEDDLNVAWSADPNPR